MAKEIFIRTCEIAVSDKDVYITTGSIGSCIVIALHENEKKIGALSHCMLSTCRKGATDCDEFDLKPKNKSGKYVEQAVRNMIKAIEQLGGSRNDLKAKIVGGASMFKQLSETKGGIGKNNIEAAIATLEENGIPLENKDVAGSTGKMAKFHVKNGLLEVTTTL